MSIVTVWHNWDDRYGGCYDCGSPAAYAAPSLYISQGMNPRAVEDHERRRDPNEFRQEEKFCSVCAASHAADGEFIVRLFREETA